MEVIVFSIPFITALILLVYFRKETTWWEYIVLIIPSILFALLVKAIMVTSNTSDIEYFGDYVTCITHYDPWDELVDVRHEEEVYRGTDSDGNPIYETVVWYTKEREYHSDEWTKRTFLHPHERSISKTEYDSINSRFKSSSVFRDMHRHFHRIDGDAHDTFWDKTVDHMYDLTETHKYTNKIKASQSHTIFKLDNITKEGAKAVGLYEYPDIVKGQQNPIIGRNASDKDKQRIKYINAMYGHSKQFRVYMLFYEGGDLELSELQKAYWQNGNKNEFVVCLGTQKDSVVWCNPFSWCDSPKLEVLTRQYFIDNPRVDIDAYGKWLQTKIDGNWKRKEFEDFKYIHIDLSQGQYITLLILMFMLNIGISAFIIKNDFKNENH